jgi:hypothetical protein
MKPVGLEVKDQEYVIIHRCQKCGKIMKNKTAGNDNFDKILEISTRG